MDIKYSLKKPENITRGYKIIGQKINDNYVYFVIKSGNKPSKALTAKLYEYFNRQEQKKQNALKQKLFNARLAKAALPLW